MIPRRNRELPFGRNSFLFSYKRRYNGNLCARSVQQAKAASSMMTCTLSDPAAYFLSTTVLCARNVSPTAYFLPTAAKSMQKMPPETDGFWTSFCVQELLPKFRRSRESAFFYSRCRYIGWLKGAVLLPGESILPSGRTTSFFIWAGAAAGLLLSQFPRHLISNETLEGKGNPKTIGFCWRSLAPFCPEANTHHFSRIFLCFFR